MLNPDITCAVNARLKMLRIIAFALIAGVVMFATIVVLLTVSQQKQNAGGPPLATSQQADLNLLRIIAGAMVLGCGSVAIVLLARGPGPESVNLTAVEDDRGQADARAAALVARFFVQRLMVLALLEAPALFGVVLVLLGGNLSDLAFVAAPLLGMILAFPTGGQWERFAARAGA